MKTFNEANAAQVMKQILSAINYLHANGIVHRDIKAENVIYETNKDDSRIKIIDFGVSINNEAKVNMKETLGNL